MLMILLRAIHLPCVCVYISCTRNKIAAHKTLHTDDDNDGDHVHATKYINDGPNINPIQRNIATTTTTTTLPSHHMCAHSFAPRKIHNAERQKKKIHNNINIKTTKLKTKRICQQIHQLFLSSLELI